MAGFELHAWETAQLREVVDALGASGPTDEAAPPIPWVGLELLRQLLRADGIALTCLDSTQPRVVFQQFIDHLTPGLDEHRGVETETLAEALENTFWRRYWDPTKGCSYPDRTGDYDWVRLASDTTSERQRRNAHHDDEWPFTKGHLSACIPTGGPGRYTRLRFWRIDADFTEREVFLTTLLKPHVELRLRDTLRGLHPAPPLTRRQLEVLRMVRAGFTNRQVARNLRISEGTVHVHLTEIYRRLGVQGRTAAVHAVFDSTQFPPVTVAKAERA